MKLLCRLYPPTRGQILVDGVPLARVSPDGWRARLAGAFQDSFRFELRARHSVGVGDLPRLDDLPAVASAVARAGASDLVAQLAAGLETQLGPSWPEGVELRTGQWQKVSLARGFMREDPLVLVLVLVLVLDEPTASLDAEPSTRRSSAMRAPRAASRSRGSSRTVSAPSAWPTSSSCSTARAWWRPARTES